MLRYNGITHFPDKRTIYIDLVEKEVIAPVRSSIVSEVRNYPQLSEAIRETDHPHLTIAAGLKPAQFEKASEVLMPHELRSEEQVTEVVLLRRAMRARVGMSMSALSRWNEGSHFSWLQFVTDCNW
ncbi:MAG: 2'-5' RNA ligase family protein [Flavobacteriales bacterium]|nr:2'-5' RNA ligase family protein [Flavobacteriales bacterium]